MKLGCEPGAEGSSGIDENVDRLPGVGVAAGVGAGELAGAGCAEAVCTLRLL